MLYVADSIYAEVKYNGFHCTKNFEGTGPKHYGCELFSRIVHGSKNSFWHFSGSARKLPYCFAGEYFTHIYTSTTFLLFIAKYLIRQVNRLDKIQTCFMFRNDSEKNCIIMT